MDLDTWLKVIGIVLVPVTMLTGHQIRLYIDTQNNKQDLLELKKEFTEIKAHYSTLEPRLMRIETLLEQMIKKLDKL